MKNYVSHWIFAIFLFSFFPQDSHSFTKGFGFWQKRVSLPSLRFTSTSQSIPGHLCSGLTTVKTYNGSGAITNVSTNLTVNLSATAGTTFYSDSECTNAISSLIISSGSNAANFYFLSTAVSTPRLTVVASNYTDAIQDQTITANNFVWTGLGGNANWSTLGNWSGGTSPGAGDVAVFNNSCSSNCSPNMTSNINVAGLRMAANFTGTITQNAGVSINIGTKGWVQLAGNFAGGNSSTTIVGVFYLSGGTYTATSGQTTKGTGYFIIENSPTFNANSGTYFLNANSIQPGSIHLNNLIMGGYLESTNLNGSSLYVDGSLTLNSTSSSPVSSLSSGTLLVGGNVDVTHHGLAGSYIIKLTGNIAGQTITGNGSSVANIEIDTGTRNVTLSGSVVTGSIKVLSVGTMVTTGSTLSLYNGVSIPGSVHYNNVVFTGYVTTMDLNGNTMYIDGTTTFSSTSGYPPAFLNNGTIQAMGNVVTTNFGMLGNVNMVFAGASDQTLTVSSHFPTGSITLATTNGAALVLGANLTAPAWQITSGNINLAGYNFSTPSLNLNGGTLTKGGGVLTVNGAVAGTGPLYGGTVNP